MLHILKHIDREKIDPLLVLFEEKGELLPELPGDIKVKVLREEASRYGLQWLIILRLAALLRSEKPDAVVSFMWYPNLVALLARLISRTRTAVIVSERTSTSIYDGTVVNFLRSLGIRLLYPKADRIVIASRALGEKLIRASRSLKGKTHVISNPVDMVAISGFANEHREHPWYRDGDNIVVAIGRLSNEKGFPYLIKAVSLLSKDDVSCRLMILGEGPARKTMESLIRELRLQERVALLGFQKNPYKYLGNSTLFVLSSLYEGFPNVLLEALALGVPSIATRCPTGPDEIITDGVDGILVPPADEKALAGAIKRLLMDEDLRKRLGDAGRKRAQDFAVEKIVKQYEDAIESVCAAPAAR